MRRATINRLRNLACYGLALGIIAFLARDVRLSELWRHFTGARLELFIPASLASFVVWFLGETYLFTLLFNFFYKPATRLSEMAVANAAQYFLQLVNTAVAGGALVLFMHRRKGIPWFGAGWTLILLTLVDSQLLALWAALAAALVPDSPMRAGWYYALAALVPFWLVFWFFRYGRPSSGFLRWIYSRPSLRPFRMAQPSQYLALALVRAPIFLVQAFLFDLQARSFGIHLPLGPLMAFAPMLLLLDGLPVTPEGLGPLQAAIIAWLSPFGPKPTLLAMGLAVSFANLLMRVPLGVGAAGAFAHEVIDVNEAGGPVPAPDEVSAAL